jgi:uncharacterized membrane protein YuzA (DUF378 family)
MRPLSRSDVFTASLGILALLAGIVVLVAGQGSLASTIGAVLLGLAGIAFVALAFLLVGESEDRDRRDGAP